MLYSRTISARIAYRLAMHAAVFSGVVPTIADGTNSARAVWNLYR